MYIYNIIWYSIQLYSFYIIYTYYNYIHAIWWMHQFLSHYRSVIICASAKGAEAIWTERAFVYQGASELEEFGNAVGCQAGSGSTWQHLRFLGVVFRFRIEDIRMR